MPNAAPPGTAYHHLARAGARSRRRAVLGTLFILVLGAVLAMLLYVVVTIAAAAAGRPENADGLNSFGERADLALAFLGIAALLPVTLLAARWIQRRPAGTLSSVAGRLRLRWLLTCLPVAFVAIVLFLGGGMALAAATDVDPGLDEPLVGWSEFGISLLVLLLVVPPQSAAEEYVTRGWLLQGLGSWFRRPWIPIALQAGVFAAAHGWGTPWGFADLLAFGIVAGWLTIRTGGLEAAIALHVMNNLTATALGAAYGELGVSETAADLPWQMTVVNVPVLIGYAAVIRWLARRQGIETRTAPVEPPPLPGEQLRWTTAPSSAASPALQRPAQGPGEVVGG